MRIFRSELAALLGAAALVAGCGPNLNFEAPHDHVTFIINGEQSAIAMEGTVSVAIDGVPELTYSGPAGCPGRYFVDSEADSYFRWTARRAYFLRGSQLYTFEGPPRQLGENIVWNERFGPDRITVLANCPLPSSADER